MTQLFKIKTKKFNSYYVLANGFDEAKRKVETKLLDSSEEEIITRDGSLNTDFALDEVSEIVLLDNKLII